MANKVIFCVDISPSMGYKTKEMTKSLIEMFNEAYNQIFLKEASECDDSVQTMLITYADEAKVVKEFREDPKDLNLSAKESGSSNLYAAFVSIADLWEKDSEKYKSSTVVVISDGDPDENCDKEEIHKGFVNLSNKNMTVYLYYVDGDFSADHEYEENISCKHYSFSENSMRDLMEDLLVNTGIDERHE